MTALTVYGVFAPDELRFYLSEFRVVPRKECLSSRLWDDGRYFFATNPVSAKCCKLTFQEENEK